MITAVILNWERHANVSRIVAGWRSIDLISEAIVWNNSATDTVQHDWAGVVNAKPDMGLYTRFAAACMARNDCVLIQDDDIELPSETLHALFNAWRNDSDVAHGVFGRKAASDGSYDPRNVDGEVPVVLTRALLMHRRYAASFFKTASYFEGIQSESRPRGNGEDIILSYTVMRYSGRLNRAHRLPVSELPAPDPIHGRNWPAHLTHRSRLMVACQQWLGGSKQMQDQRCFNPDNVVAKAKAATLPPLRSHEILKPEREGSRVIHRFNPSLIRFQGKLLTAYRINRVKGRIGLSELDDGFRLRQETVLELPWHADSVEGQEDPRLFLFKGELWLSYSGLARPRNTVMLAKITPEGEILEHVVPNYPNRVGREKNWAFFESKGELLAVYHGAPHRILRLDGGNAVLLTGSSHHFVPPTEFEWPYGDVRGGAPPVRVDDQWYHFFHTRLGRLYCLGLYTFADKPPYQILQVARKPLYTPLDKQPAEDVPHVVFPGGAIFDGDRWLIAVGEWDSCGRILEYSHSDIESCLESV